MARKVGASFALDEALIASLMKRAVTGPAAKITSTGLLLRESATLSGSRMTTVTFSGATSYCLRIAWRTLTLMTLPPSLVMPRLTTPMRRPLMSPIFSIFFALLPLLPLAAGLAGPSAGDPGAGTISTATFLRMTATASPECGIATSRRTMANSTSLASSALALSAVRP